jgi:hypothetical protein
MTTPRRFRDRDVVFANGARGQNIEIPSANPPNYWQAISDPAAMPRVTIDGKLFLPKAAQRVPVVIVVPGSLGISAGHLTHAETLVGLGIRRRGGGESAGDAAGDRSAAHRPAGP